MRIPLRVRMKQKVRRRARERDRFQAQRGTLMQTKRKAGEEESGEMGGKWTDQLSDLADHLTHSHLISRNAIRLGW